MDRGELGRFPFSAEHYDRAQVSPTGDAEPDPKHAELVSLWVGENDP
jgi:hypothetical protein